MFLPAISSEASAKSRGLSLAMKYCASSIQSKILEITEVRSASTVEDAIASGHPRNLLGQG